ncbi:hypothetical protein ACFXDE_08335 [Kitasatospora sp. NPDC059408]|uniref:hypothetical protein n=1 Tax=Kitasatospora sp. NPDC059408 TaxID=3346823 RepID=UPI0036935F40
MSAEQFLTLDPASADFVVDVSNVVRDDALLSARKADLERLTALCRALASHVGDHTLQIYAVVDDSLLTDSYLTRAERAQLHDWVEAGLMEPRTVADDRLIEIADLSGVSVVSDDGFVEFHRRYPWISGNRDRFVKPVPLPGGRVGIVRRVMPVPEDWQITRKEEERLLLSAGMLDRRTGSGPRREFLERLWRCPERGCRLFEGGRRTGAGQALPRHDRGRAVCPTHRLPLIDRGPRPSQVEVKIHVNDEVQTRVVVVAGHDVVVGRDPVARKGQRAVLIGPWLTGAATHLVSRSHVRLACHDGVLEAHDTSTNGCRVRSADGTEREVRPGRTWQLRRGQRLLLHESVWVEISGRTFVFEGETPLPKAPARSEPSGPTMLGQILPKQDHRKGRRPTR